MGEAPRSARGNTKKEIKRFIRLKTLDVDNNHIEIRLDLVENGKVVKSRKTVGDQITLGFLQLHYDYGGSQQWRLSYIPESGRDENKCKYLEKGMTLFSIPSSDVTSDSWHFTSWIDRIYYTENVDVSECTLGYLKTLMSMSQ